MHCQRIDLVNSYRKSASDIVSDRKSQSEGIGSELTTYRKARVHFRTTAGRVPFLDQNVPMNGGSAHTANVPFLPVSYQLFRPAMVKERATYRVPHRASYIPIIGFFRLSIG